MKKILLCFSLTGLLSACQSFCHEPTSTPTEKQTIRTDIKANPQIVNPNP